MGRVWRREVVAIRCELRSCAATVRLIPAVAHETSWHDHVELLSTMVSSGWAVVITNKFRTYCPNHAEQAWACTCRTNPTRRHLCVVHTAEVASLVWDAAQTPIVVSEILKVAS